MSQIYLDLRVRFLESPTYQKNKHGQVTALSDTIYLFGTWIRVYRMNRCTDQIKTVKNHDNGP
jgi:hypothetical protein